MATPSSGKGRGRQFKKESPQEDEEENDKEAIQATGLNPAVSLSTHGDIGRKAVDSSVLPDSQRPTR